MRKRKKKSSADSAHQTTISCNAPSATAVFLAGTFNNWNQEETPMSRTSDGMWSISLSLPPGHYEYKFIVDGSWCCEPGCSGEHICPNCLLNEFGSMNRSLEVTA